VLIVIEGVDGSGKQTHTEKIYGRLTREGLRAQLIRFPDYDSDASAPVKMYLGGKFGTKPEDVSPYAASTFYAVDRIASYLTRWKTAYQRGDFILADRYTTSNAVHQACKLAPDERERYLAWLFEFEYGILELPTPDLVVFLDMPPAFGRRLTDGRRNKMTGGEERDIHERDFAHLDASYHAALYAAEKYGWRVVHCVRGGELRSVDDINDEIYKLIRG
jgi:dTMP kinase